MASNSKIEWTTASWNPVTGCDKVSPGCRFCYAETMAKRLHAMETLGYENEFQVTLHYDRLQAPAKFPTKTPPTKIFVCSMSDLFHDKVPASFIQRVFQTMNENPQHIFQVLTKRPRRAVEIAPSVQWTPNIWMGTTVEIEQYKKESILEDRVGWLTLIPSAVRFLSCEPLLGPLPSLKYYLTDVGYEKGRPRIDWVIVGGESGNRRVRPMQQEWATEIRDACLATGTAFFFKQWGNHNAEGVYMSKSRAGHTLEGQTWHEYPVIHESATIIPDSYCEVCGKFPGHQDEVTARYVSLLVCDPCEYQLCLSQEKQFDRDHR